MAKRLIDAEALPVHKAYCVDEAGWGANIYVVDKSDIDNAPTVDAVEVVHGRWVFGELGPVGAPVKCSNCGWGVNGADPILWMEYSGHKFCGHCGAKMDGERRSDE